MEDKEFQGPIDQGVYQVEANVIAIIFGLVLARIGWKVIVPAFQIESSIGIAAMLALSGLFILIGLVLYTEWIYRIGRSGWVVRIVVNAATVLAFLALYFY